jgi:hypothetical protein
VQRIILLFSHSESKPAETRKFFYRRMSCSIMVYKVKAWQLASNSIHSASVYWPYCEKYSSFYYNIKIVAFFQVFDQPQPHIVITQCLDPIQSFVKTCAPFYGKNCLTIQCLDAAQDLVHNYQGAYSGNGSTSWELINRQ